MADEDGPIPTKEMVALRKMQAAMYARQTKLFLRRLNKKPQLRQVEGAPEGTFEIVPGTALSMDEFREAIIAFCHRDETVESFSRAIVFCGTNKEFKLPMGKDREVVIPLHPQLSMSFVSAFATYIAVDAKVMYTNVLKDLLAYQSYLIEMAGGDDDSKPKRRRSFARAGGD